MNRTDKKLWLCQKLYIMLSIAVIVTITATKAFVRARLGIMTRAIGDAYAREWAHRMLAIVDAKITHIHFSKPLHYLPHRHYILMSNHVSHYDIPIIFEALPGSIRMLAKKELFSIPIFGRLLKENEFPSIDRNDRKQVFKDLEQAESFLKSGIVLWIAPEGTRARQENQLGPFKKGGFILAIKSQALIIPIGIRGTSKILPAHSLNFTTGAHVEVYVGEPIDAALFNLENKEMLIQQTEQAIAQLASVQVSKEKAHNMMLFDLFRELTLNQFIFILKKNYKHPLLFLKKIYKKLYNPDYNRWIIAYDTLNESMIENMKTHIQTFSYQPLISVVMPVYNIPIIYLEQTIESVRNQIYEQWELCIADDASTDPQIKILLEKYKKMDARIKVIYREQNGHISAASNSAISLVKGEYIALLDHDDSLSQNALFCVAAAINENPDVKLLYSDEDKINKNGKRFDPYFKGQWNYDLFLTHNMISHLGVYKTSLVHEVGMFHLGFEGSQDYDLALRCIERLSAKEIVHIPKILYHWRAIAGSCALGIQQKNYAQLAALRAIQEHLNRLGIAASVVVVPYTGYYRVCYTHNNHSASSEPQDKII